MILNLGHVNLDTSDFHQLAYRANADKPITILTQTQVPARHQQDRYLLSPACSANHIVLRQTRPAWHAEEVVRVNIGGSVVDFTVSESFLALVSAL